MWSNISARPQATKTLEEEDGLSPAANKQNLWSPSGGSPLMRYKHAVCSAPSGHIYVHGGRHGNLPLEDDVWRFDPHQNTWLQLETRAGSHGQGKPPGGLQEHTLVEHQDRLYLFGGQVSASSSEHSLWRLDLLTSEWRSLSLESSRRAGAYLGPTNRRGHSAVVYQDSMYVYGGFVDFRGSSGQLWQFDLVNERGWELRNLSATAASHPEPRHSHSAIVHQDSMYVYGGLCNLKPLGDLWRWSWREQRWFREKTRGQSPGQLHGHTAVQAFGSMFVFGGERRGRPSRSLWRLNLANLVWQKVRPRGPRPAPITWHAAVANPLSILDETNYIIEGDPGLLLKSSNGSSSLSDHCFPPPGELITANRQQVAAVACKPPQIEAKKLVTHSKSSSAIVGQQAAMATTEPPSRPRRRSRLSFLGRGRRHTSHFQQQARKYELKPSASALGLLGTVTSAQEPPRAPEMKANKNEAATTTILDSLDTDIKQMFERAEVDAAAATTTQEESLCASQSYVTARNQLNSSLDVAAQTSMTLNQRTSAAYSTPPSELASLTSRSRALLAASTPAERAFGRRGDTRPKSEIVQSLIERADARIKHLYTPFFTPSVARHHQQTTMNSNRLSLGERPKRHTIPQTSTYYNLYFAEGAEQAEQPTRIEMKRDDLSSSTIRTIQAASRRLQAAQQTNGTLVGVHEAAARQQPSSELASQASLASSAESRTLCGHLNESSHTTTLREESQHPTGPTTSNGSPAGVQSIPSALTVARDTLASGEQSADNTSLSFSIIAEFEEDDMLQYSSPTEASRMERRRYEDLEPGEQVADEEYLAIGRTYRHISQEFLMNTNEHQQMELDLSPRREQEEQQEEDLAKRQAAHKSASSGYDSISGADSNNQNHHNHQATTTNILGMNNGASEPDTESSLGGFTSETSPEQSAAKHKRLRARQSNCVAQTSSLLIQPKVKQETATTTTSSITADSLALTNSTTSDGGLDSSMGKSLPSSPPATVAAAATSVATILATQPKQPLRSKLFGKQKSKTRYWQLCMFVIGGKQGGSHGGQNEPITIWRLYI